MPLNNPNKLVSLTSWTLVESLLRSAVEGPFSGNSCFFVCVFVCFCFYFCHVPQEKSHNTYPPFLLFFLYLSFSPFSVIFLSFLSLFPCPVFFHPPFFLWDKQLRPTHSASLELLLQKERSSWPWAGPQNAGVQTSLSPFKENGLLLSLCLVSGHFKCLINNIMTIYLGNV